MKKIYSYKIKTGAYSKMRRILRFSEQVEPIIDEKICRVICDNQINELNLRKSEVENYKNDILFTVEILDDKIERGYMVLGSLLEDLDEVIIVQ
jgi:hypothetical protein